jgi:dihydrolipoamide dehydrogenase
MLAAGSVPRTIPGFEPGGPVITSDEVLMLTARCPARVAVIGGGAIGCEFASTFADLGARSPSSRACRRSCPAVDRRGRQRSWCAAFKKKGIDIRTGVKVTGHTPNGTAAPPCTSASDGDPLEVDAVVVSVGRRPFVRQLGLRGHRP